MKQPNLYSLRLKQVTQLFTIIIGLTFIVSGFTKAVDPWGTAIKFDEYFITYGLEAIMPLSRILAVWLCGAELMMGCMILFRVRLRLISIFALLSMTLFTVVTILSVTLFPVEDCGCFGDALYLTPWQTLIKNLIILPMVFTIWWRYRPDKIFNFNPREAVLATLFFVATMSFSAYNYFHLPMIDFLPYKVGVDLLADLESTAADVEYTVVLIYRNIASGELREFKMEDSEWQDSTKWEWVETRTQIPQSTRLSSSSNFSLSKESGENVTLELLSTPGRLNMLAITNLGKISSNCLIRLEEYLNKSQSSGEHSIIITSQELNQSHYMIGNHNVECYNIDPTTLKTIMRSSVGVVELESGVIGAKRSCIDL